MVPAQISTCWIFFLLPVLEGFTGTAEDHMDLYCDFETRCIDLLQDNMWQVTEAAEMPNSYAPAVDHTFLNNTGHYLYLATSGSRSGHLVSPVFDFHQERCLEFYYVMNGHPKVTKVGNIKVWLTMGSTRSVKEYWLDVIGNNGPTWNQVYVRLPRGRYSIAIQAYLLFYRNDRVIAIDDVKVTTCSHIQNKTTNKKEPNVLKRCNFEKQSACNYSSSNKDIFRFQRILAKYAPGISSKYVPRIWLPERDHTSSTSGGHYLYAAAPPSEGSAKLLVGEFTIPNDGPYCLDFYYNYSLRAAPARLYLYNISENFVTVLWNQVDTATPSVGEWHWAAVALWPGVVRLAFELRVYAFEWLRGNAVFALDDLTIAKCDLLKTIPKPPVLFNSRLPSVLPTNFNCSFNNGSMCGGRTDTNYEYTWQVQPVGYTGIKGRLNNKGSFLFFHTKLPIVISRRSTASFQLPKLWTLQRSCIEFFYFMDGNEEDEVELRISGKVSPHRNRILWSGIGRDRGTWRRVYLRLPYTDFTLYFVATKRATSLLRLALDDIMISQCVKHTTLSTANPNVQPKIVRTSPINGVTSGQNQTSDVINRVTNKYEKTAPTESFQERWTGTGGTQQGQCKCDCTKECNNILRDTYRVATPCVPISDGGSRVPSGGSTGSISHFLLMSMLTIWACHMGFTCTT